MMFAFQGQLGMAWGKLQAVTLECFQKEVSGGINA
jgi:hypothetical protein